MLGVDDIANDLRFFIFFDGGAADSAKDVDEVGVASVVGRVSDSGAARFFFALMVALVPRTESR